MNLTFDTELPGNPIVDRVSNASSPAREFALSFGKLTIHMARDEARRVLEQLAAEFAQIRAEKRT